MNIDLESIFSELDQKPTYFCAICNFPVWLKDEKIIKSCEHRDAAIVANMTAVVRGQSVFK